MVVSLSEKLKLRRLIKQLKQYRGRHTELVSVYIPGGYDLTKIINSLQDEQGTATNIKDKNTSKSVITALERLIRTLRTIDKTPQNGLALFSGNISDRDNIDDFEVFVIEPPEPLNLKLYRCDQRFILDALEEMDANEAKYALIVIDKSEATIGMLIGTSIRVIKNFHSTVPGKFKAGGQSAQRFARIREGAAIEFYKRVADAMIQEFTYMTDLKGIIIGGPGTTKNNFVSGNYINEEIKKKILGIKDMTYTSPAGLYELLDKSDDLLVNDEVMTEKTNLREFFQILATSTNMVVYGLKRTKFALEASAVSKLIIIDTEISDDDLRELSELAELSKAEIVLVTDKTAEGQQYKGLTGIGGILRYPIES